MTNFIVDFNLNFNLNFNSRFISFFKSKMEIPTRSERDGKICDDHFTFLGECLQIHQASFLFKKQEIMKAWGTREPYLSKEIISEYYKNYVTKRLDRARETYFKRITNGVSLEDDGQRRAKEHDDRIKPIRDQIEKGNLLPFPIFGETAQDQLNLLKKLSPSDVTELMVELTKINYIIDT